MPAVFTAKTLPIATSALSLKSGKESFCAQVLLKWQYIYITCEHECIAHDFCCLLCFWLTVSGWVYRGKHTPVTLAVNAGFAYPLVLFKQDTVYTLLLHTEQCTHHTLHKHDQHFPGAPVYSAAVDLANAAVRSWQGWSRRSSEA